MTPCRSIRDQTKQETFPSSAASAIDGHGTNRQRRRLENFGRAVGGNRAAPTAARTGPSARLPSSARAGPKRDERDLVRAADGLPMERTERHRYMFEFISAPALFGVDRERRLRTRVGSSVVCIRRVRWSRLGVAVDGRCDVEGAAWGGKKQGPIQQTAPRAAASAAY